MINISTAPSFSITKQCVIVIALFSSCATQNIKKTPAPAYYNTIDGTALENGYSLQRQPWHVYSDRENNQISTKPKLSYNANFKTATFLQPFIVLKKKNGMIKVAEYSNGLINDGKIPRNKKLKIIGWIPENKLLLWSNTLKVAQSGFLSKGILVVNNQDVLDNSSKYFENDSVNVFFAPDQLKKNDVKLPIGKIVYIYKESEDKTQYLIGSLPNINPENVNKGIIGWVSKNLVSLWGDRTAVKLTAIETNNSQIKAIGDVDSQSIISAKLLSSKKDVESIYPLIKIDGNAHNSVKFLTNALNYDRNNIYNVLGNPIYFKKYQKILEDNKKLNIVFVLDGSSNNRLYFPLVKSLLQELQIRFSTTPSYFEKIKFGGVVYKNNSCGNGPASSILSNNYRDVVGFLEKESVDDNCNDYALAQPVDRGLLSAAKMLSNSVDETNVVIVIGTTADQGYQTQSVINALTWVNAKMIFFQTQSKSSNSYNNFVLLGEKAVVSSALNISELKKEKLVNQNDVIINNNFNLTGGENGFYSLDFPNQSMTQGFVIFPKKGETMPTNSLTIAIDTLLKQVTFDNKHVDSTLTAYFHSQIGVNNTFLKPVYNNNFPNQNNNTVSTSIASTLLNKNNSFLMNGDLFNTIDTARKFQYGVLLNEQELDQLRNFYVDVCNHVFASKNFDKSKSMNEYLDLITYYSAKTNHLSKSKLKSLKMSELVKISTGYPYSESEIMNKMVADWYNENLVSSQTAEDYFKQFQTIANNLSVAKGNELIKVNANGQTLYWLNEDYFPQAKIPQEINN